MIRIRSGCTIARICSAVARSCGPYGLSGSRLDAMRRCSIALMRTSRVITVVGCHAGGEVGNVVVGGVLPPPGETVFERMLALEADDSLRRLLETGMVEMEEPETVLRLEAPAGVVEVRAACRNGKCESVELTNVPCFAAHVDAPLEVAGIGTLVVHVAFGGMWYAIADARELGFALEPQEARDLCDTGELIRLAAREQLPCVHPENEQIAGVSIVQIAEPWQGIGKTSKNAVVIAPGRLDRSATGTGLSARIIPSTWS